MYHVLIIKGTNNIFKDKNQQTAKENYDLEKLHATIGKLKVENDFLQDAWQKLKD